MTGEVRGILEKHRSTKAVKTTFIVSLIICCAALALVGCGIGPIRFKTVDVMRTLANVFFGCDFRLPDGAQAVITLIRLPRIILALLAGFGLAVCGMQMQVVLRNPLASPLTLGVSAGAALGAALSIIAGFNFADGRYMLIFNAFIFALIPSVVIFMMSRCGVSGYGMIILAGVAMNFIFSSLTTLLSYFSESEELKALSLWMMGNLGRSTWSDIATLAVVIGTVTPLLFLQNQKLNVLNSGDESAEGLGVNVERTRITVMALTALLSAAVVCFTGIIGFVGLVAPHIVRMIIGCDTRYLMPASGFFGAAFLLASDLVSLKIIEPAVLPVGIITSLAGGPLLLWLILQKHRERVW